VKSSRLLHVAGWLCLTVGVLLAGAIYLPLGQGSRTVTFDLDQANSPLNLPESLTIHETWRQNLWVGQSGQVGLTLAPSESAQSNSLSWQDSWVIESRLELGGFLVDPQGTASGSLRPAHSLTFRWQVTPLSAYKAQGTLWVYSVRKAAGGESQRDLLLASPIDIRSIGSGGVRWAYLRVAAWGFVLLGTMSLLVSWVVRPRKQP
jgi:hypothetical protein